MKFPDYIPAKRADVPDMVRAEFLQHQADMEAKKYNDEQKRNRNALPAEMYNSYSQITGTNPIADALARNKEVPRDSGPTPTGTDPLGGAAPSPTPTGSPPGGISPAPAAGNAGAGVDPLAMQGLSAGQAGNAMSGMPSASTVINPGTQAATQGGAKLGGDVMGKAGGAVAGNTAAAAIPVAGGLISGGLTAAQGGSTGEVAKSGVGGAATGALAAYGAPMAAAGPVGWAGIAALAAASLYGMLG